MKKKMGERFCAQTGRQEMTGSDPDRAFRPSRSEFSMIFSEAGINIGYDPLER